MQCRSGRPMGFLHVEMLPVRSLSCVALDLQGNRHRKFILDRLQRKTSRAGFCISQNSLLPLPVPLSHLCELLVQSRMLMTLVISFDSKQFISHVFQVALNLLSWVHFASFSQGYCAHHVCPASQVCFAVKEKLVS